MNVRTFTLIAKDRVMVTFNNGVTKILGIYHQTKQSILCDDFETYIKFN